MDTVSISHRYSVTQIMMSAVMERACVCKDVLTKTVLTHVHALSATNSMTMDMHVMVSYNNLVEAHCLVCWL